MYYSLLSYSLVALLGIPFAFFHMDSYSDVLIDACRNVKASAAHTASGLFLSAL